MEKLEEHDKKAQCKDKIESLKAKKLQSKMPLQYRSQRQFLVYRKKWLKQEHGRN